MTGKGRDGQPGRRSLAGVAWWSLALLLAAIAAALPAGLAAAAGVALGGGLMLCSLTLHMGLASLWARGRARWSRRGYLCFVWVAKWPLMAAVLWYCLAREVASPAWVCVGAGVVPAVATALALRSSWRAGGIPVKGSANAGAH